MIIRDYGFASYLILIGYEYSVNKNEVSIDINTDDFKKYNVIYKETYAAKDKVLRDLLKKIGK